MIYRDHFQNYKRYNIPKAQLIIADIPYNLGKNAFASNPSWYEGGDNKNGQSVLAGTSFFDTDEDFRPAEFMHFCSTMLKAEVKPKKVEGEARQKGDAPCMIIFCAFDQQMHLIELAKRYGLNNYINLIFRKNFSAQVLKANMKIVGNCEYGLVLYRERLPKFRNNGKMIFNCMDWPRDNESEKIHPCLPANEKVFFNNEWKNIQDVNIGDICPYGKVIGKTDHYADNLVQITVGKEVTIATFNHPFLIKRGNSVYWVSAEKIKNNDLILSNFYVSCTQKPVKETWKRKQQKKDIFGLEERKKEYSSIFLFGKAILVKFQLVCKYTIKILTRKTISLKTCNLSLPLNINGYTLVADLSMENGKSLAKFAGNLKRRIRKIGIFLVDGLMGKSANPALSKNHYRSERFLLRKVGNVKTIQEKTNVYNLTIDEIPAFDTLVGVSHNTQKPVELLKTLISIFTDEGDVVIDPVAGSGSTLVAAERLNRKGFGFEIKKEFFTKANIWLAEEKLERKEIEELGFAKTKLNKIAPTLWT